MVREASCSCGGLRARCSGEPVRISVCHCLACRRRTGSAFGVQARYPADQVELVGEASTWQRTGESGGTATFRFCPRCGATVWWELSGVPGVIAVAVGAFADPAFPPPTVAVYEDRQSAWVTLGDSVTDHFA